MGSIYIPLSQDKSALVDAEHANFINQYKWSWKPSAHDYATGQGYAHRGNSSGQKFYMHRELWLHVHGSIPPGIEIDHINGDSLDNQLSNLREANRRMQVINNHRRRQGITRSRYPGVTWHNGQQKWIAQIQTHDKKYRRYFSTEEEAGRAYQAALLDIENNIEPWLANRSKKKSKYPGVTWDEKCKRWRARIQRHGKIYHLGTFLNEEDAGQAYQKAKEESERINKGEVSL